MILPPDDSVARPFAGRADACAAAPDAPRSADAQNNAATRGAVSTLRRRKPPCLRAGCNPSDAPRADRPRSGCAGEPAASPGNRVSPPPFPACAPLPAVRPRDSVPSLFPPASVPTPPRRPPSLPERPFRSDLHSGAFRRAPVFSPAPVKPRAAPARHASVPRADSDFSPALRSPSGSRVRSPAFSCAFPALLPDSVPLFCASFVKKHYKVSTRCAKPLQRRASSRSALRPAPQQHRNVSRRSQVANIKQLLRFRRDCDHAFIAVRSPFPIPRCRARQRFFRIFSSRNPLL